MKNAKFLILRRIVQILILVLFFGGNYWGWKILLGNYSSAYVFESFYLADPYAVIQMTFAGVILATDIYIGALIIVLFYALIGGRAFCSWVCPVNIITDFAHWIRRKTKMNQADIKVPVKRTIRYWILALGIIVSILTGVAAFEFVSPISILHRGIIFGFGFAWTAVLLILLFDIFVLRNGWCGYVCPLGAFYSIINKISIIKVQHTHDKCTLCMKCVAICPERQILHMIGKETTQVKSGECTNCGRCIDVCDDNSLKFSIIKFKKNK